MFLRKFMSISENFRAYGKCGMNLMMKLVGGRTFKMLPTKKEGKFLKFRIKCLPSWKQGKVLFKEDLIKRNFFQKKLQNLKKKVLKIVIFQFFFKSWRNHDLKSSYSSSVDPSRSSCFCSFSRLKTRTLLRRHSSSPGALEVWLNIDLDVQTVNMIQKCSDIFFSFWVAVMTHIQIKTKNYGLSYINPNWKAEYNLNGVFKVISTLSISRLLVVICYLDSTSFKIVSFNRIVMKKILEDFYQTQFFKKINLAKKIKIKKNWNSKIDYLKRYFLGKNMHNSNGKMAKIGPSGAHFWIPKFLSFLFFFCQTKFLEQLCLVKVSPKLFSWLSN